MKRILSLALVLVMCIGVFVGCGSNTDNAEGESKNLKIGTSAAAQKIAESGISEMEKLGYTVEVVMFDDYQSPDRALHEGSIDFNFYQHIPFMEDFNASNGTNIVMIEPVIWNYFLGLYSTKYDSIEAIPEGSLIALGTNASSISMQLEYCAGWGLFTLADAPSDGEYYTELDIIDNPKKLTFVSVEGAQRYNTADEYAAYIGTSDEMFSMGIDPNANLLETRTDDTWALGISVNADRKDSQMVKDIVAAYTSETAINYVKEQMNGAYVLADVAKTALGIK